MTVVVIRELRVVDIVRPRAFVCTSDDDGEESGVALAAAMDELIAAQRAVVEMNAERVLRGGRIIRRLR